MNRIVRLLVFFFLAILITTSLIAGGHKYVPYPVIFVHGFNANSGSWDTTKSNLENLYLYKYGYKPNPQNPSDPPYFPLMNYGVVSNGEAFSKNGDLKRIAVEPVNGLGIVLYNAIGNAFYKSGGAHDPNSALVPEEEQKVILVCHSYGGLVIRSLLKQNETINPLVTDPSGNLLPAGYFKSHIAHVIFIDTPHGGSPLASSLVTLGKAHKQINGLLPQYEAHSYIVSGHTFQLNNPYTLMVNQMKDFQLLIDGVNGLSQMAGVDTSLDREGYDTSLELLQLNDAVFFKKVFAVRGLPAEVVEINTYGSQTFLGNAGQNLGVPNKFSIIYSDLKGSWLSVNPINLDLFCRLGAKIYDNMLSSYFAFPPGDSLEDLYKAGDAIVTVKSATTLSGGKLYPIEDYSHVQETSYWQKIREVLLQDLVSIEADSPLGGVVYMAHFPLKGKLKHYLPLDCGINVELLDKTEDSITYGCNIVYDPNKQENDLDLNPHYEESADNYQAYFVKSIPLFSNKSPANNTLFKLALKPYDTAATYGEEKSLTFTYTNFIYGTAPSDQSQEVTLDTPIVIYCQENVRAETVNASNIRITPSIAGTFLAQGKVITFTPTAPLQDNTQYTVTIKGDDPTTYNVAYPTSTIEGVHYYLNDSTVSDSNADKHGWEPDYTFSFTTNVPPSAHIKDMGINSSNIYLNCDDTERQRVPGSMTAVCYGVDNVSKTKDIKIVWNVRNEAGGIIETGSHVGYTTATVTGLGPGKYTLNAQATDEAGNQGDWTSRWFVITEQTWKDSCAPPGGDLNPDESYAIYNTPEYEAIQVDLNGDVAILGKGFIYEASQFLSQLKIPFNIRDPKALLTSKRYPVLFIPTAGLDGLENSPTFRNDLAQYVSEGGTIICMTQPHGYHFQALPGGSLTGVGYTEDISCWVSAFGQSHDHPIFYGLHPLTWIGSQDYMLDTYADGYFLKWSPETKVLATRLYNNMPGIVEYGYGQGRV